MSNAPMRLRVLAGDDRARVELAEGLRALAAGEVVPLSGEWKEQIFAISRWPTRASAEDFWFADRYQGTAIPIRIGAGKFTVHVLEET